MRRRGLLAHDLPLHQCRFVMVLEDGFDFRIEGRILRRIAHQITDHAYIPRVGQLDHRDDIGAGLLECGMNGIPAPDPAKETAAARNLMPSQMVRRMAFMANPFRPPLKRAASVASLDDEFMPPRRVPEFLVQTVALRARRRQSLGQIVFFLGCHRVTPPNCYGRSGRSPATPSDPTRPARSCNPAPGRSTRRAPGAPPRSPIRAHACSTRRYCRRSC